MNSSPLLRKGEISSNEWKCPKCGTVNPKYVGTCNCGCTLDAYNMEMERRKRKYAAEQQKLMEEEKKKNESNEAELNGLLSEYKLYNLSSAQEYALKVISKKQGLTIADICRQLPRSANLTEFKDSINFLLENKIIKKDEEEKYYLSEKDKPTEENETDALKTISKEEEMIQSISKEKSEAEKTVSSNEPLDKYAEVRKYKELLDEGIISHEEFEKKKKELLGL